MERTNIMRRGFGFGRALGGPAFSVFTFPFLLLPADISVTSFIVDYHVRQPLVQMQRIPLADGHLLIQTRQLAQ